MTDYHFESGQVSGVSAAAGPPQADLIEKETFGLVPIGVGVGIGIGIGQQPATFDTDTEI